MASKNKKSLSYSVKLSYNGNLKNDINLHNILKEQVKLLEEQLEVNCIDTNIKISLNNKYDNSDKIMI